jgi:hypothetical protein
MPAWRKRKEGSEDPVGRGSFELRVGREDFFGVDSLDGKFSAIFEDDGDTGYFYGLENGRDDPILDALHIYNVAQVTDPDAVYPTEIRWDKSGSRAGLFIDGKCHAVFDFTLRRAVCRTGFPPATGAFASSHEWDERLVEGLV